MKAPAFQFYTGDWMKDPALRSCGPAARGLWVDCLCLMFESPERGYLRHGNGSPVTARQLARMTGCTVAEIGKLLRELEDVGVFSRGEDGAIYSRRMVRDEEHRRAMAENGAKGGRPANPNNRQTGNQDPNQDGNQTGNQDRNQTRNLTANQEPNQDGNLNRGSSSSSSSSTSVKDKEEKTPLPPAEPGGEKPSPSKFDPLAVPLPFASDAFRRAWAEWVEYRRQRKPALTERAVEKQLPALAKVSEADAIAAIEASIRNDWQGLFPERVHAGRPPPLSKGQAADNYAIGVLFEGLANADRDDDAGDAGEF